MITIEDLKSQLKNLYIIDERVTFNLPEYERFQSDLCKFIYENHFQNTPEWSTISNNLIYRSTEVLVWQDADIIMIQLEKLHRRLLTQINEGFWSYVHPLITAISQQKFVNRHYADAVESAFKEINSRLKKIYRKQRGEEKDGSKLMKQIFSVDNPLLIFEGLDSASGKNVQIGYMEIFSGAMTGIRNPKAHENQIITRDAAIKRLVFAGLLMDKIDEALIYSKIIE